MPRIFKALPENRADYSFGDLVYWHLFKFGTRPKVDPSAKVGRPWRVEEIASKIHVTPRTIRNWVHDKNLPDHIDNLCQVLFGDNSRWDEARVELQDRLAAGGPSNRATATVGQADPPNDDAEPEEIEADAQTESEEGSDDQGIEETIDAASSGDDHARQDDAQIGDADAIEAKPSGVLATAPPTMLRLSRSQSDGHRTRRAVASLIASLAIVVGMSAWLIDSRRSPLVREASPPVATAPQPQIQVEAAPEPKRVTPPAEPPKSALPLERPTIEQQAEPSPSALPKPPVITEEERRQIEERRLEAEHMEARRQAYDAERRAREQEAIRRDSEDDAQARDVARREADARIAAGMGYRLQEHRSVEGSSFANLLAATVHDCAAACTRQSCDAFGYYREEYGLDVRRPRTCYLFRKPYRVGNNSGYVLGEVTSATENSRGTLDSSFDRPIELAQATVSSPKTDDGVTRCATGPVKVSGFKLTCDRILGCGTVPRSTQISFTVSNINECAAKCRPVADCVGFTFNAGDPEGSHSCVIFGPTPEARDAKGWVSGVR